MDFPFFQAILVLESG